jgi:hypothetical protein
MMNLGCPTDLVAASGDRLPRVALRARLMSARRDGRRDAVTATTWVGTWSETAFSERDGRTEAGPVRDRAGTVIGKNRASIRGIARPTAPG